MSAAVSVPAVFSSGLLLLDKPAGPTSHDIVAWARRVLRNKRVGHCGTLDPMATGLLLLGVGDALRYQARLTGELKVYRGRFRLGLSTDTDDITGRPLAPERRAEGAAGAGPREITEERLREVFREFLGARDQRVPRYSAVKVNGRKLYEWARDGVVVDLPVKRVEVFRFELASYAPPLAGFVVECSKGTYVRALARDVGERLGVGAALESLCRESIGSFLRKGAYVWDGRRGIDPEILRDAFIPMGRLRELVGLPAEGGEGADEDD